MIKIRLKIGDEVKLNKKIHELNKGKYHNNYSAHIKSFYHVDMGFGYEKDMVILDHEIAGCINWDVDHLELALPVKVSRFSNKKQPVYQRRK